VPALIETPKSRFSFGVVPRVTGLRCKVEDRKMIGQRSQAR
jgi:hypothetical protein